MKKLALLFLAARALAAAASRPPKLVLALAVDQFRYDYLTRFRADYHAGFSRLLTRGAVFTNAHYEHFPTVTAIGHSTFLTGATPAMSGIVGNDWFDRESGKNVTSVSDDSVKLLGGGDARGSSPRRLLVSTVGDELKIAGGNQPKVIGISLKDRSAILPAGHMADGAYWFDAKSGNFVSSTYYFDELPAWVRDFNAARPADRFKGAVWAGRKYPDEIGEKLYESLPESPFSNELIEALAERAVKAEKLGARGVTDLLAVSFSANDYIGHDVGRMRPPFAKSRSRPTSCWASSSSFSTRKWAWITCWWCSPPIMAWLRCLKPTRRATCREAGFSRALSAIPCKPRSRKNMAPETGYRVLRNIRST